MGIPLYLKLKSSPGGDFLLEGNSITFKSNDYHFQKIINSNELIETLDHDVNANVDGYGEGDSIPYVIFVGPTGSGKTTSLKELLQYKLANVKAPVFISAFEVSNNKFAIDLLETDPTLMKKQFQHLVRDSSKKIKIDSIESKDIILNEIFKKD